VNQIGPGTATEGSPDLRLKRQVEGRLLGLRVNRYSWWVHWRELADYLLPRRYKWLITPNQMARGSPINQHILDSTATLAARNLASGMMSGITSPTRPWFKLKIGRLDSTQTSPISLWLAECERLMMLVFQESNFYNAVAVLYLDLVVFGTGVMLIYEDFDDVIRCYNPCAGEYYLDSSDKLRPNVLYREFTYTVDQVVQEFGKENVSPSVRSLFEQGGASLTRELVVAHAIEPNQDGRRFGIPDNFKFREVYWEWGGSASPQGGSAYPPGLLRKRGYHEAPHIPVRWDVVSNDAYGRSPAMDALGDTKQLQLEVRRKAQAIDKLVNPPMVADIMLKNQPASLLPGGVTYVSGMVSQGRPGFAPVYQVAPPVKEIMEDLNEVRGRIKDIFFNNLFQTISQYETRSNVSATEIDARRAESLVMLGPVLERVEDELLSPIIERVFPIMSRAGIFPPAPPQIAGAAVNIEYVSMLATAQAAAATSGIERLFQVAGGLVGVDPAVMDNINVDYALDKYSSLMNNDPRIIRSADQLAAIRANRAQQQEQQQKAELAEKMAAGAKTLSETNVGGGQNALEKMTNG
jgi:Bacteriophage head to tail connecting protein